MVIKQEGHSKQKLNAKVMKYTCSNHCSTETVMTITHKQLDAMYMFS